MQPAAAAAAPLAEFRLRSRGNCARRERDSCSPGLEGARDQSQGRLEYVYTPRTSALGRRVAAERCRRVPPAPPATAMARHGAPWPQHCTLGKYTHRPTGRCGGGTAQLWPRSTLSALLNNPAAARVTVYPLRYDCAEQACKISVAHDDSPSLLARRCSAAPRHSHSPARALHESRPMTLKRALPNATTSARPALSVPTRLQTTPQAICCKPAAATSPSLQAARHCGRTQPACPCYAAHWPAPCGRTDTALRC